MVMFNCSSCVPYQVYCAQILVPVSYIPLQETMKILDVMQDRKETGRDVLRSKLCFRISTEKCHRDLVQCSECCSSASF